MMIAFTALFFFGFPVVLAVAVPAIVYVLASGFPPELIAQRLVRYAKIVGRENVIGGADCGFASFAAKEQEIHPSIVWAKFKNLAEGARIASKQLWA